MSTADSFKQVAGARVVAVRARTRRVDIRRNVYHPS